MNKKEMEYRKKYYQTPNNKQRIKDRSRKRYNELREALNRIKFIDDIENKEIYL